jgi:hypothetical protein
VGGFIEWRRYVRKIIDLSGQSWFDYEPIPSRDIRKLSDKFLSLDAAEDERRTRIEMLAESKGRVNQELASLLKKAPPRELSSVGCDPLVSRQYQVYFSGRALAVHEQQSRKPKAFTFFDVEDAVESGELASVDWRTLHLRHRRRLERTLGSHIVAIGMGELEADEERGIWQPHHHVMIYGARKEDLEALRQKHYQAERTGPRPMKRSPIDIPALWFSYMSKLTAFGKFVERSNGLEGPPMRTRLSPKMSREYFRHISRILPTSLVFSMNCQIVKGS